MNMMQRFDERFKWAHTPEGRGYLYDVIGNQSVDEVIMKDFIQSELSSLRERVEGLRKVSVEWAVEDRASYDSAFDAVLRIIDEM